MEAEHYLGKKFPRNYERNVYTIFYEKGCVQGNIRNKCFELGDKQVYNSFKFFFSIQRRKQLLDFWNGSVDFGRKRKRGLASDSDAWEQHAEAEVKEARKPSIKKVTHRRRGCNEFPELNEGEPEPRGWCPVQRCYRHTEAGKRVCRSAAPFSPQLYPEFSRDLVLQRAQIEAQIEEDEAMARQFERDGERSVDGRSAVEQLPYGWREAIDPRGIPYYYFFDGRTRQTQWDRPTHPIWHPSSQNPRQIHCSVCGQAGHNRRTHARRSGKK